MHSLSPVERPFRYAISDALYKGKLGWAIVSENGNFVVKDRWGNTVISFTEVKKAERFIGFVTARLQPTNKEFKEVISYLYMLKETGGFDEYVYTNVLTALRPWWQKRLRRLLAEQKTASAT